MLGEGSFERARGVFAGIAHHESQPKPRFSSDWVVEALADLHAKGIKKADWQTIREEIYDHYPFARPWWNRAGVTRGQLGRTLNTLLLDNKVVSDTVPDPDHKSHIIVLWSLNLQPSGDSLTF